MNPSLWSAYEKLIKLGELLEPSEIFVQNRFKLYENNRKKNISSFLPMLRSPIFNSGNNGSNSNRSNKSPEVGGSAEDKPVERGSAREFNLEFDNTQGSTS